jgi:hypothetical protein
MKIFLPNVTRDEFLGKISIYFNPPSQNTPNRENPKILILGSDVWRKSIISKMLAKYGWSDSCSSTWSFLWVNLHMLVLQCTFCGAVPKSIGNTIFKPWSVQCSKLLNILGSEAKVKLRSIQKRWGVLYYTVSDINTKYNKKKGQDHSEFEPCFRGLACIAQF